MAFTFDPSVGGANSSNTASVEFADAYFETRPFSTAWTSILDTLKKQAALIAGANRLEDEEYRLSGSRATLGQRLCQPRIQAYSDDIASTAHYDVQRGVAIAREWMEAECEMAIYLLELKSGPTVVDKLAGFSEVKLPSGLELKTRTDAPRTNDGLPVAVRRKLRKLICDRSHSVERA